MKENQDPNNDVEKNQETLNRNSTLNRLNVLDIPGHGDVKKAIDHGKANMLYKINAQNIKNLEDIKKCECCEQLLVEDKNGEAILTKYAFCSNIKDLSSSGGVGIFLYFYFLKFCIWMLIISSILSSAPFIYLSYNTRTDLINYCNKGLNNFTICKDRVKNSTNWLNYITSENFEIYKNISHQVFISNNPGSTERAPYNLLDYNFISLITQILLLFVYLIFYNNVINLSGEIDIVNLTPSDYTLMISEFPNIPSTSKEENIKQNLKDYLSTPDITINSIVPAYDLRKYNNVYGQYYRLCLKLSEIQKSKEGVLKEGFLCAKKMITKEMLKSDLDKAKTELKREGEELVANLDKRNYFSNVAFVIFDKIADYEEFYSWFPHSFLSYVWFKAKRIFSCCCRFKKNSKEWEWFNSFKVEKAPEPEDVIWENLYFSDSERLRRKIKTYIYSFLLTIINLGVILGMNYAQEKYNSGKIGDYAISVGISVSITIINSIIIFVLRELSNYEKPKSFTELYLTMSIKLTFLTFLNSAILPVLANLAIKNWDLDLLITNVFIIFLSNSFVTPILQLVDFSYFFLLIRRKFVSDKLTQRELNLLFENPSMDIAYRYSYIFKTVLQSFFFITLFPIGGLISFFGIFLSYIIEKYLILFRFKKPQSINDTITMYYVSYFKIALFVYSIGNYVFVNNVEGRTRLDLLQIIGFGVLTILPVHKLFRCSYLGVVESKLNQYKYDSVKKFFFFDYYNLNPIEEIEIQMQKIHKEEDEKEGFVPTKRIKQSEFKRNALISDNMLFRAIGGNNNILNFEENNDAETLKINPGEADTGFAPMHKNLLEKNVFNKFTQNVFMRKEKSAVSIQPPAAQPFRDNGFSAFPMQLNQIPYPPEEYRRYINENVNQIILTEGIENRGQNNNEV